MGATPSQPLVSIVMPSYNSVAYLGKAVGSVRSQTLGDWELIVVDDGSADGSLELARRLEAEDGRVRILALGENRGVARARNMGIAASRGKYLAFLDSDDLWEPEKLERQVSEMRATGLSLCTCAYRMRFEDASADGGRASVFHVPGRIAYGDMLRVNYFSCSTLVLERGLAGEGLFDPEMPHEDYAAWLGLLKGGAVACGIDEPLATYRVHAGSRSSDKLRVARDRWRVLHDCTDEPLAKRVGLFAGYAFAGARKYLGKGRR